MVPISGKSVYDGKLNEILSQQRLLTSISSSNRWRGSFRIMHFRAARRPFISWGDSSSTHACAVAMRAFFYFEKSWLHLYYLAGGGIVSGPVQT